ncbi:MAG: hypothetical protein PH343_03050 [Nitrospira sp.]|nr:hypothetical protein [Nitrospira sp.]
MATINTFPHGVHEMNSSHVEVPKKELNKEEREKRDLYISGVLIGSVISIGMLFGAYFLLW